MHRINVLAFGSKNFNTSLKELKDHLVFKLTTANHISEIKSLDDYDILLVNEDYLKEKSSKNLLEQINNIKILVRSLNKFNYSYFTDEIVLPASINEINQIVQNSIAKNNFTKNSSIKVKEYILDKNKKRLIRNIDFILLTEKEIQLLELLIKNKEAINKDKILEEVWKYSSDADTHTVETHIYRLRKKIEDEFSDNNFIINNKEGYLI